MSHDDFDENYAMPPVRVHTGDELPKRIAQGIADRWDAGAVRGLMAWCDQYERALCWIATHGDAQSAMLACKSIVGRADECIESMHIAALTGAEGVRVEAQLCNKQEIEMEKDDALNTLAKVFHNGEEMEGEDGMVMVVDLALWNDGCEAIEALIGGEDDGA